VLSHRQQQVALHDGGHAKVTAVAGAGKTTTTIEYVLNRLAAGIRPRRVMVIMFNRSAQVEFKLKLERACEGRFNPVPDVRTFHSLGLSIATRAAEEGFLDRFDPQPLTDGQLNLQALICLKAAAPGPLQGQIKENQSSWLDAFTTFIDLTKSHLEGPAATLEKYGYKPELNFFVSAFESFEAWRKAHRKMTFADFLYDPCLLLQHNEAARQFFENKIDIFCVDEFQDTNQIQFELLRFLAGTRASIMAIGDADQAIYEFRGADPTLMVSGFDKAFSPARYQMPETWRYGHRVALAASYLISNNQHRDDILCVSRGSDAAVDIRLEQQTATGSEIASNYLSLIDEGYAPKDIVILCRLWSLAATAELALLSKGIPYRLSGGRPIFERPEIQAMLTAMQLAAGTGNNANSPPPALAVENLLGQCNLKIKRQDLKSVAELCTANSDDALETLRLVKLPNLNRFQQKALDGLAECLCHARTGNTAKEVLERFVLGMNYIETLRTSSLQQEDGDNKAIGAQAFFEYVLGQGNKTVPELISGINDLVCRGGDAAVDDRVEITTMHRAKGLEWPVVMIPGLSAAHMPYLREGGVGPDRDAKEGERRLLYVAITRAKERLYLYAPGAVAMKGLRSLSDQEPTCVPSPFLLEMRLNDANRLGAALEKSLPAGVVSSTGKAIAERYIAQLGIEMCVSNYDTGLNTLREGMPLVYREYGRGVVVSKDAAFINIAFQNNLLISFPLVIVGRDIQFELQGNARGDGSMSIGAEINHEAFGRGVVVLVKDDYVYVDFPGARDLKVFKREAFG